MNQFEACITAKEVSAILACCERTVVRLMQAGELEAFRIRGSRWRTTYALVVAYQQREIGIGRAKRYGLMPPPL